MIKSKEEAVQKVSLFARTSHRFTGLCQRAYSFLQHFTRSLILTDFDKEQAALTEKIWKEVYLQEPVPVNK